jgi:type IV pilus assembly protein PilA
MSRFRGFTLIELLVVILILAVLMAIALPLYLRAVRDSERQTCRSNMQTIANAEQAYRVRSAGHQYVPATGSTSDLTLLIDPTNHTQDLQALPQCPSDTDQNALDDYNVEVLEDNGLVTGITITCNREATHGSFTPGVDSQ